MVNIHDFEFFFSKKEKLSNMLNVLRSNIFGAILRIIWLECNNRNLSGPLELMMLFGGRYCYQCSILDF